MEHVIFGEDTSSSSEEEEAYEKEYLKARSQEIRFQ
jgi:hypothetical protein